MSNPVEMMNASNGGEPWLLANLLSKCPQDRTAESKALQSILPGPFCILQGSPGDGMANTLDSMPMLPIESTLARNNEDGGRRRSSTVMSSSLHPLEEMVVEEEEHQDDNTNHRSCSRRTNKVDDNDGRNDGTNNQSNATTTTTSSTIGRERSDSLTGGGLHYPLGEKSPIMQRRVRSLSLNSTLMQQQPSSSLHRQNEWRREFSSSPRGLPFVRHNEEGGLQEHQHQQHLVSNNNNTGLPNYAPISRRPNTVRRRVVVNKSSTTTNNKSSAEMNAIHKWHHEVSQQEQSHLEERHQNVKLLLDRRKRSQERMVVIQQQQQQEQQQHELSNDAAHHHHDQHDDPHHRSGSPMALATATSASSSSNGDGGSYQGSNNDDGSSAIISSSRPSTPPLVTATTSATTSATTPHTITVTPPIIKQQEQQVVEDPITQYMNSLELEISHRSWYQKNGRLVVFNSLPYRSVNGKVVVHPLEFEEEGEEERKLQQQQQQEEEGEEYWEKDDVVVTLAPGTTVMAEEAITLDSHSLKRIHSTSDDQHRQQQQQQQSSRNLTTNDASTLVFLHISSPYTGYILSHIHNYPYLAPGLPTTYTNSTWLWRVTCQPDGAFIRSGLDLVTDHIGTLPYGTLCCVKKKVVNYMGLNRLEIDAFVSNDDDDCSDENDGKESFASTPTSKLSGYISEFLNPLSGQRGNIVEMVPFPCPALYKVIHAEGAIIRSGVELSTKQIGFAPIGSVLSIIGRSYSSNPSDNCIERLRLAGGGGWISVKLNRGDYGRLVEMIGVDESFDPEDPANFHFEQQKKVMAELKADDNGGPSSPTNNGGGGSGGGGGVNMHLPRRRSTANLSEIAEDDQMSIPNSEGVAAMNDAENNTPPCQSSTTAAVPTLFQRSGVVGSLGGLVAMDAVRESSSDKHQNENANRCLICLSDERTATIVHGETGHIACCLTCARILKARGDNCPVCRLPIDLVIQQFWA